MNKIKQNLMCFIPSYIHMQYLDFQEKNLNLDRDLNHGSPGTRHEIFMLNLNYS